MKKQILLNIVSNYAGRGVGMLIGFFLVPFLVLKLGKELFGLIVLFEAVMVFVESASTSIRVALSHHATFALSAGNKDEFTSYLSTGRGIFFVLSAVLFVSGVLISSSIPYIFRIPESYQQDSRIFFMLLTCSFAISIPNVVYWTGLYAKQRFDLINLASSAGIILRGVAIFACFSLLPSKHLNLVTYGLICLVMTWTQNFAIYLAFKKILFDAVISLKFFDMKKVRKILSFSMYTVSGHLSSIFHDNVIGWMINRMWGASSNALFGIGMKFTGLIEKIFLEPTWTLTPTFTDLAAKGENDKLKQFLFVYSKSVGILLIPVCFVLMIYSDEIIHAWVGDGFSESAVIMFVGLLGQMIHIPIAACHNFPYALGKVRLPGILSPVFSIVSLLFCFLFSIRFGLGLKGMAIGATVSYTLYSLFFSVPYGLRIAGISVREYAFHAYLKPFFWAVIFWGLVLLGIFWPEKKFAISFTPIAILFLSAPFYFLGAYRFVLNSRDRVYVSQGIQAVKQRFVKAAQPA